MPSVSSEKPNKSFEVESIDLSTAVQIYLQDRENEIRDGGDLHNITNEASDETDAYHWGMIPF
ncbi:hypothetical protein OB920_07660 [Halobacteria archaeon HArc-gm2]|nr:hypothetical protein [Halobacteria archaeon HArc-gm2]